MSGKGKAFKKMLCAFKGWGGAREKGNLKKLNAF